MGRHSIDGPQIDTVNLNYATILEGAPVGYEHTTEDIPIEAYQSDYTSVQSDDELQRFDVVVGSAVAAVSPVDEKALEPEAPLLPATIFHDARLIAQAEFGDNIILICPSIDLVGILAEFGIPAVATPDGAWTVKDALALRQAGLDRNLCLYSSDAGWIHSTAKALGESFTTDAPLVAEPSDEPNLTPVYDRINNPAAGLQIYDWQSEEERRRDSLLPAPFDLSRDVSEIPRTDFIYGPHYIRREVSVTVAAAGTGKSFLTLTETVAMASGRNLLGQSVTKPRSVWYWSEDHLHDAEIRLRAAMERYGVTADEIGGRIRLSSFRDTKLKLAVIEKGQIKIDRARVDEIAHAARDEGIDVIVFDTLKKIHGLNENSNPEMDTLLDELIRIAEIGQCSVETVHHMGKPRERTQDMNSLRGASSIIGAVRAGRFLCRMTMEEGKKAGVENHKAYFSVESGKFNKSAEDKTRRWFELSGRDMANGENVGQLSRWEWPDSFGGMSNDDAAAILDVLHATPMRASDQCDDWAGHAVADHMGYDLNTKADKSKVKTILKTWFDNEALEKVERADSKRNMRPYYQATGKHRT